jgi:hypothetical protein
MQPEPKNGKGMRSPIIEPDPETTGQFRQQAKADIRKIGLSQIAATLTILGVLAFQFSIWVNKADKSAVEEIKGDVATMKSDLGWVRGYIEGGRELPLSSPLRNKPIITSIHK